MTTLLRTRTQIALSLIGLMLLTGAAHAQAVKIERIAVTVSDLGQTEAFYRDGLGFRTVIRKSFDGSGTENRLAASEPAEVLTMELGHEQVEFVRYREPGRSYPAGSRSPDLWFQHFAVVVADMDVAYARLRQVNFHPISIDGPQTLPKKDGSVRAFKFRDPDGHPLELLYFPQGKGRNVWSAHPHGVTDLGIDHTAISVSDTPASTAFYAKLLGMKVAYHVVNYGAAQGRLDGIRKPTVRITGLRPGSQDGPGIELLDYRTAPRGKSSPTDTRDDDLWHAQVVLRVDNLEELVAKLIRNKVHFISSGMVPLVDGRWTAEIADPDGHALLLEE